MPLFKPINLLSIVMTPSFLYTFEIRSRIADISTSSNNHYNTIIDSSVSHLLLSTWYDDYHDLIIIIIWSPTLSHLQSRRRLRHASSSWRPSWASQLLTSTPCCNAFNDSKVTQNTGLVMFATKLTQCQKYSWPWVRGCSRKTELRTRPVWTRKECNISKQGNSFI